MITTYQSNRLPREGISRRQFLMMGGPRPFTFSLTEHLRNGLPAASYVRTIWFPIPDEAPSREPEQHHMSANRDVECRRPMSRAKATDALKERLKGDDGVRSQDSGNVGGSSTALQSNVATGIVVAAAAGGGNDSGGEDGGDDGGGESGGGDDDGEPPMQPLIATSMEWWKVSAIASVVVTAAVLICWIVYMPPLRYWRHLVPSLMGSFAATFVVCLGLDPRTWFRRMAEVCVVALAGLNMLAGAEMTLPTIGHIKLPGSDPWTSVVLGVLAVTFGLLHYQKSKEKE